MSSSSSLPGWRQVTGLVVALAAALTVVLVAFAWPPSQMEPRDLPLAVTGPSSPTGQVVGVAGDAPRADAFHVVPVASRDAAVAAVENREVYGAVVATADGPEMLVSSAASPVVSQMLTQVGTQMAAASGSAPTVTDVVPLPEEDPRGAVFAAGAFPLVIGGIAVGVALALRLPGRGRRVAAGLAVAVASGLALAGVLQFWFSALDGSYWANAGVYALAVAAMAAAVIGLYNVVGVPGLGLAAATILLLGNPLSAITSAPELLPEGWSLLGQLLPPGAAGSALRSTAYFDGAGAVAPLLVLATWLVAGVALSVLPSRRVATEPSGRRPATPTSRTVDAPQPV